MRIEYVKNGENKVTVVEGSNKKCSVHMLGVSVNVMTISFETNSVEDVDKAIEALQYIKVCHVLNKNV